MVTLAIRRRRKSRDPRAILPGLLPDRGNRLMRPMQIAACLALATATVVAFAQDPAEQAQPMAEAVSPAAAEPAPPAAAAPATSQGDIERGRQLTYTCQGCHGARGYENAHPSYHGPKIGGQSEA